MAQKKAAPQVRHFKEVPPSKAGAPPRGSKWDDIMVLDGVPGKAAYARTWAKTKGNGRKFVQRTVDGKLWTIRVK